MSDVVRVTRLIRSSPERLFMSHRGQDVVHSGTYLVIDRPHTLEFTWRSPVTQLRNSMVRVTFIPDADATLVSVRHEQLPDAESARLHAEGWTEILDCYDTYVPGMEEA